MTSLYVVTSSYYRPRPHQVAVELQISHLINVTIYYILSDCVQSLRPSDSAGEMGTLPSGPVRIRERQPAGLNRTRSEQPELLLLLNLSVP